METGASDVRHRCFNYGQTWKPWIRGLLLAQRYDALLCKREKTPLPLGKLQGLHGCWIRSWPRHLDFAFRWVTNLLVGNTKTKCKAMIFRKF